MQAINQETYDFQARPRVIQVKQKFKVEQEEEYKILYQNLMFDKHIVRGSTYAPIVNPDKETNQINYKYQNRIAKKKLLNIQEQKQDFDEGSSAVDGRSHAQVQTDEFVETYTDQPPEYEKECQTTFDITEPLKEYKIKEMTGTSREQQIYNGDLFDFEYEVEPMLEVLVSKTLQDSRLEVLQEEELNTLKQQQIHFKELQQQEDAHQKKFENIEHLKVQAKEEKVKKYRITYEKNILSHKYMVSRMLAKQFCYKFEEKNLDYLEKQGIFRSEFQHHLYTSFVPSVYDNVHTESIQRSLIKQFLAAFKTDVIQQNISNHKDIYQQKMVKINEIKALNAQKRQEELEEQNRKDEEKAKRKEAKRREEIRQNIISNLLKEEEKNGVLTGNLSDINGYNQQNSFVGLFGNVFGEFVVFVDALLAISSDKYDVKLNLEEDAIPNIFMEVIIYIFTLEGTIDMPVSNFALEVLATKFDEENQVTFDNLKESLNTDKQQIILDVLKEDFFEHPPFILKLLLEYENNMYKENIYKFVNQLFEILQFEDNITKINWIQWQGVVPKVIVQVAVAKMTPDLNQLGLSSKHDRYDEYNNYQEFLQQQKEQKEAQEEEPYQQDYEPREQPLPIEVVNIAESEFENKYRPFNPVGDIKCMVLHPIAETLYRQLIISEFGKINQVFLDKELQILTDLTDLISQTQLQVLATHSPDFPVLEMGSY